MGNFLQYTNITYQDIINAINTYLAGDSRYENFRESAIAQTLIEIFAATTDINNFYIQRQAEESFMETAKRKSSVILLSKLLGYSITRPIPAEAKIKIKISGDLTGKNIVENDVLQIPIYSKFTYDDLDLILKDTYQYTFTSADVANIASLSGDFEKELILDDAGNSIYVIQGLQKSKTIEGATNSQVGQKFQKYKIEDLTFSNKFGDQDYDTPITNVWVGSGKTDETKYLIDRKSLINWNTIELFQKGDPVKVCLIKTSPDENIELLFGDAKISELGANLSATGPITTFDNIYIDYLSTQGLNGNRTGIINEELSTSISLYVNGDVSKDITSNTKFYFYSNLTGGADIESIDEIRHNAPNIFYTMDRLVTAKDYVNYLKSLTSPINFKNAIAWGEQEELDGTTREPISKLFNVAMFSCLGSMYNLAGTSYSPKENLEDVVVDLDFDEDGIPYQSYWNLYMKQSVVDQLKYYETSGTYHNLYGDVIPQSYEYIKNNFTQNTLTFNLGSDYHSSAITQNISTSAINLSTVTDYTGIASAIQTALLGVSDTRGTTATNENYGQLAFNDLTFIYDSENTRFILSGGKNDSCHIVSFPTTVFPQALGINKNSTSVSYTNTDKTISTNLSNLIANVNKKSQLTVRNVYISPIIQKFNLTGKIYVKQLADKDDLHRQIKNAIYTWLNINADFNTEIYLSNLTELIEQYPSVIYADIKLEPFVPTLPSGQTQWFNPKSDSRIDKLIYTSERETIYDIFAQKITNYLSDSTKATSEATNVTLWEDLPNFHRLAHLKTNYYLRKISERTFYTELVKEIYDALPTTNPNGTPFRDSQDFLDVISDMHKDLIYIIRYNMLDSNGNIATENTVELVNGVEKSNYYRGGYSMRNEIAKIIINTECLYKV